ncbi:MAG TPA: hypothetical protein VMN57_14280 [Anaerolineales bacterium]|nr:hypothetical protein [Anaerolineales bacterium]
MEDKITIIEGPPPTFEAVQDGWAQGISDSPFFSGVLSTRLRTFDGPALVERCQTAWSSRNPIHLEYKTMDGLREEAPIIAARNVQTDEGDMLMLWVRVEEDDLELEIAYEDDDEDEYDEEDDEDFDPDML